MMKNDEDLYPLLLLSRKLAGTSFYHLLSLPPVLPYPVISEFLLLNKDLGWKPKAS